MHHLQRKCCTMNSGMDAPSQTVTMHHGQRSACTIRRGVFTLEDAKNIFNSAQCRRIISDRIMKELKARLDGLEFRI